MQTKFHEDRNALVTWGGFLLNDFALAATASAFLAVGFSMPAGQSHDEFDREFVVANK